MLNYTVSDLHMLLLQPQNWQGHCHKTTLLLLSIERDILRFLFHLKNGLGNLVLSIYYSIAFILLTSMAFPKSILGVIVQWDADNFPLDIFPSPSQNYNSPWFPGNTKGQLNQFKVIEWVLALKRFFHSIISTIQFGHTTNAICGGIIEIHIFLRD